MGKAGGGGGGGLCAVVKKKKTPLSFIGYLLAFWSVTESCSGHQFQQISRYFNTPFICRHSCKNIVLLSSSVSTNIKVFQHRDCLSAFMQKHCFALLSVKITAHVQNCIACLSVLDFLYH